MKIRRLKFRKICHGGNIIHKTTTCHYTASHFLPLTHRICCPSQSAAMATRARRKPKRRSTCPGCGDMVLDIHRHVTAVSNNAAKYWKCLLANGRPLPEALSFPSDAVDMFLQQLENSNNHGFYCTGCKSDTSVPMTVHWLQNPTCHVAYLYANFTTQYQGVGMDNKSPPLAERHTNPTDATDTRAKDLAVGKDTGSKEEKESELMLVKQSPSASSVDTPSYLGDGGDCLSLSTIHVNPRQRKVSPPHRQGRLGWPYQRVLLPGTWSTLGFRGKWHSCSYSRSRNKWRTCIGTSSDGQISRFSIYAEPYPGAYSLKYNCWSAPRAQPGATGHINDSTGSRAYLRDLCRHSVYRNPFRNQWFLKSFMWHVTAQKHNK